eukprot:gnl/TRDRNA2_/TRDRNA2_135048_c0_seq1.p1 gnl/TRDRNA2_/TRDRNA2_135048_c0~~gnl/TRDRNA2_/TRDRNA2_135048_c0_seq1.p1  ORF type:complete len:470 (-),score=55.39 gnl/TRDRNA2_/TRDRNA2_135048_c0_seq1:335-1744(-)
MEKDLRAPLGQPEPDAARESLPGAVTLAEAYDRVGFGRYQARLFIVCGFGFMSDSIEVGLVTALQEEARVEWPDVRGVELAMLTTVVFVGELLGAIIWGPLADRMGRKRAFLASNLAIISFGVLSAAAPSFWWLTALRGLVGVAIGGIIIPFDNLSESVSERHSAPLGFAIEYWWTLGTLYINGLAAVVLQAPWGGWRSLVLLSCVPLVLACLGYFVLDESPTWLLSCVPLVLACLGYFVLDESPTWLLDVGREAEALAVVQKAAAYNGKDLGDAIALVPYERESEPSFRDLFSPELRRRTISLSLIWALGLFGFYGASLANPYIFGASNNGASESSIDYGEVGWFLHGSHGSYDQKLLFPAGALRQLGRVCRCYACAGRCLEARRCSHGHGTHVCDSNSRLREHPLREDGADDCARAAGLRPTHRRDGRQLVRLGRDTSGVSNAGSLYSARDAKWCRPNWRCPGYSLA